MTTAPDEPAGLAGEPIPSPTSDAPPVPPAGNEAPDPARVSVVLIAILLVAGVVTYLGPILKPFLVAVFLFFASRAAAAFLTRLGIPTWLAYLVLFLASLGATAALSLFAYGEAMSIRDSWPRYQQRIQSWIGKGPDETHAALGELLKVSSKQSFQYLFERGLGLVELLIMTFFYLLFIILGASHMGQRVHRAFPGARADRILTVAGRIGTGIEQFMRVKTVVSAGMGATSAILMYFFGLEHWLLWGVLFFVLNYITYIGSIAACVPPIALAYLDFDSFIAATVLGSLIVANRLIWIDYIEIKMSGRHLNIDSILLFLWLAYWGWVWGVVGLVLAFPMITSLKIVLEHLEATRHWAVMMSEE